ncbi:MAG: hypothetical protein LBK52_03965 [Deltaproteobacteria bacterium]|jgi:hypothetical protein|nr:hypothetical protein [Deltaproteobacteria bacterium]
MFCRSVFWIWLVPLALMICAGCSSSDDLTPKENVLPAVYPPKSPGVLLVKKLFSDVPAASPEVIYYYGYSCPPCTRAEKELIPSLARQLPPGTKLTKLPYLGPSQADPWYSHGRMAVALEMMGIEEELRQPIMERIQSADPSVKKKNYNNVKVLVSAEEQADFIAGRGYSREQYLRVLNSPECQARLDRIFDYQSINVIPAVPAVIVHGEWYYILESSRPEAAVKSIMPLVLKVLNEKFPPVRRQSPPVQPPDPRLQFPLPVLDGEPVRPDSVSLSSGRIPA